VGRGPEGAAFDPATGLLAVAIQRPAHVALLDPQSGEVRRRVPLAGPARHLQLAAPGGPVLAPVPSAGVLQEVPTDGGPVRTIRTGGAPHDATRTLGRTFVTDRERDELVVVEGGRVTDRVAVGEDPDGVAPIGRGQVALLTGRARTLELVAGATLAPLGERPAGVGPTHLVTDGVELLYVLDTHGERLLVFHTLPRLELTRNYQLPGRPWGIAVDEVNERLWITLTGSNRLLALTADGRPRRIGEWPSVRQPSSVAVDPTLDRVFVTGRADGVVQILDP
jgi:DNA-binding beta-propeller fold protein YncE